MKKRKNFKKILALISGLLLVAPLFFTQAFFAGWPEEFFNNLPGQESGSAQVSNEINVSAITGRSIISNGGEVEEGNAKAGVRIESVVNGQAIEPVNIESETGEVKVKSRIKTEDDKIIVEREIQVGEEKTEENYVLGDSSREQGEQNERQIGEAGNQDSKAGEGGKEDNKEGGSSKEINSLAGEDEREEHFLARSGAASREALSIVKNVWKDLFASLGNFLLKIFKGGIF